VAFRHHSPKEVLIFPACSKRFVKRVFIPVEKHAAK
jgi:hypothetical protein